MTGVFREMPAETVTGELGPKTEQPRRLWLVALAVSLATATAIILPFFRLGNASGHDFEFHLASWLEVARQWHQGIWYPRWHEWANHGFGEPRFLFYPPLSWLLGALLGLVCPWNAVPALFIVLTQTLAGLCAFALARRIMNSGGALLAAGCYAANPYALLVIYVRSDFAEQLASAIVPLLLLFALELCGYLPSARRRPAAVALFGLAYAAIWLCNAPAGVLASYAMAAAFAFSALRTRDWRIAAAGASALLLGLALAAFYLLPAAYEQKWVNIGQALSAGLSPADNFLFARTADPEHDAFNRIASTIAVLTLGVTALGFAISRKATSGLTRDVRARGVRAVLSVLALCAALLMWRFSLPVWMALPKLRFVQFPWRWTLILAIPCSVWVGAAVSHRRRTALAAAALAMAAVSMASAVYLVKHTWWDPDDVPALESWLGSGKGFDGTDEYDPAGDDRTDLPESAPPVNVLPPETGQKPSTIVEIRKWTAEQRVLRVRSNGPGRLALRVVNYPAWRVAINGQEVVPGHAPGTEQMVLAVPAGESNVTIAFARTMDRSLGAAVSWLAAVLALALLGAGSRGRV